jgi:menaquinone-dependent protoporphyrinogen oxidase
VFYATREGHTRQIAERLATEFYKLGFQTDMRNVATVEPALDFDGYSAMILAASVHAGKHEPEMLRFVKDHRAHLERIPTGFLSVTLSQAGVERTDATPEEHTRFSADVQKVLDDFFQETAWHPSRVKPVAGALLYTRYNFFIRFIMKRISKKSGGATDTSRDYDYTDWLGLDQFVHNFAEENLHEFAG